MKNPAKINKDCFPDAFWLDAGKLKNPYTLMIFYHFEKKTVGTAVFNSLA